MKSLCHSGVKKRFLTDTYTCGIKPGQKKALKPGYFFTKNSIRPKITMGISARKI